MNVPLVDLKLQYKNLQAEIDNAISSVIAETAFIGGKYMLQFEKDFATAYGVKHCISCGNGTDSLYIIMRMLGIGAGDEVITVANSWISSAETISQTGADVVFVDINPDYYSIDEKLIEAKITPATKALLIVHLQGQVCELDAIQAICKKYNLYLIEDCAQAHFSEYKGQLTGTIGIAGSFSFYPGKNLGAYGDAGCIITNDDALAEKCRMFGRHGALIKHQHKMPGINSRLDGLQAAIISAKLPFIHEWNDARIKHAAYYTEQLKNIPQVVTPVVRPDTKHTFHVYQIRAERRNELGAYLKGNGIETALHYPVPLPFMEAYSNLGLTAAAFPVVADYQQQILSLPMYPELTEVQIDYIVGMVRQFYDK